jgi:hypothetical protein
MTINRKTANVITYQPEKSQRRQFSLFCIIVVAVLFSGRSTANAQRDLKTFDYEGLVKQRSPDGPP